MFWAIKSKPVGLNDKWYHFGKQKSRATTCCETGSNKILTQDPPYPLIRYPYVKIGKKVTILSIMSKLAIPTSTFWTIKSKPLRVMRQMSTFWNHKKEYFHMLKVEQNQRTFILPPPSRLKRINPSPINNDFSLYFLEGYLNMAVTSLKIIQFGLKLARMMIRRCNLVI